MTDIPSITPAKGFHNGDPCPKCGAKLSATMGTMYLRGRWFAGLVCTPCNALWDNADDSMLDFARHPSPSVQLVCCCALGRLYCPIHLDSRAL